MLKSMLEKKLPKTISQVKTKLAQLLKNELHYKDAGTPPEHGLPRIEH
jgi:hypothetical protein